MCDQPIYIYMIYKHLVATSATAIYCRGQLNKYLVSHFLPIIVSVEMLLMEIFGGQKSEKYLKIIGNMNVLIMLYYSRTYFNNKNCNQKQEHF